ncbi:MAG: hypothetical protein RIQ89_1714 [Bacteroidota bacterium]|jgi:uncharacterized protein
MSTNSIFQYFVPKDRKFFPLFEQISKNANNIAKTMYEALTVTPDKRGPHLRQIEKLEHVGDELTHQVFSEVSTTFITPFDREDIQRLASAIDDVADHLHGASKRLELYNITEIHPAMIKLTELCIDGTRELDKAVQALRSMRNLGQIREALVAINSIENHADDIFDNAVARLFEDEKDAIKLIKTKEILQALETATDKCEDAANVIESVIVKFA